MALAPPPPQAQGAEVGVGAVADEEGEMTLLQDIAAWCLLLFGILVAAWMAMTGELAKAQGDWE